MFKTRPKIVLIEYNQDDILLIKEALNEQTIESDLVIFNDGGPAIDYFLNENLVLPDLILLDLFLPHVQGTEVLKHIRNNENLKNVPVLIFSCSEEHNDLLQSYQYGANSFIRKQLDPFEFKIALRNLDIYWLLKY